MGAGASIADQQGLQKAMEAERARPSRAVDNSMRASQRSVTRGSVRAMALMNHARQENSYLRADVLSSYHRKSDRDKEKSSHRLQPDGAPDAKNKKFVEGNGTKPVSPDAPLDQINERSGSMDEQSGEGLQSLSMFRSNFNLKLNLGAGGEGDETDWTQGGVSDTEDDVDVSLNRFDNRLIELPNEDASSSASPDVSAARRRQNASQAEAEVPALSVNVDGLNVGVGAQGIIRPDRSAESRVGKLPMRERLVILCKLGAGASSAVYKALDLHEMRLVALKTIQVYDKDKRVQMIRELSALFQLIRENSRRESTMNRQKLLRRPEKYIVDFFDAFSNLEDGVVCLMIEYMDGGSLQDIVDQGGCDDESTLANISIQALKGLSFLHGNLQLHRDLKPANFLISHRGEVKVADLGIMKQLVQTKPGQLPRTNTFVGTASYMSPERIDGKEYSFPSDIWAFGLSLMTLAMGRLPIDTQGGYWSILHGIRDAAPPSLPDTFSPEFRDFIDVCLKKKPEERASCNQLLKHKFLNKAVPDDLTYDQSYDRGKKELLSIIQAVISHVTQLRTDYRDKYSSEMDYKSQCGVGHERVFGNLYADSMSTILRRVILQEDDKAVPSANDRLRRRKPRLATLSRQLHIQMDRALVEVKEFIHSLQQQELS